MAHPLADLALKIDSLLQNPMNKKQFDSQCNEYLKLNSAMASTTNGELIHIEDDLPNPLRTRSGSICDFEGKLPPALTCEKYAALAAMHAKVFEDERVDLCNPLLTGDYNLAARITWNILLRDAESANEDVRLRIESFLQFVTLDLARISQNPDKKGILDGLANSETLRQKIYLQIQKMKRDAGKSPGQIRVWIGTPEGKNLREEIEAEILRVPKNRTGKANTIRSIVLAALASTYPSQVKQNH